MRKHDLVVFATSFVVAFLLFGSTAAVWVRAHPSLGPGNGAQSASTGASAPHAPTTATPAPSGGAAVPRPSPTAQPTPVIGVTQVPIRGYAFQPPVIQVPVGTTVTWTNQDRAPHTVTFTNHMADSGLLRTGDSFKYTFTAPGTFRYYCAYHPAMVATVIVTP